MVHHTQEMHQTSDFSVEYVIFSSISFPFREMIPPSEKKIIASAAMMAQFRMPATDAYRCEFELIVVLRPGMSLSRAIPCMPSPISLPS